jgi:hypothetical protein
MIDIVNGSIRRNFEVWELSFYEEWGDYGSGNRYVFGYVYGIEPGGAGTGNVYGYGNGTSRIR